MLDPKLGLVWMQGLRRRAKRGFTNLSVTKRGKNFRGQLNVFFTTGHSDNYLFHLFQIQSQKSLPPPRPPKDLSCSLPGLHCGKMSQVPL